MTYHETPAKTTSLHFASLENLRENSLDISLISCGKQEDPAGNLRQEIHYDYHLYFILSGKGTASIQEQTIPLESGDSFLLYPQTDVSLQVDNDQAWQLAWIGFKGIWAEKILDQAGFSSTKLIKPFPHSQKILDYIEQFLQNSQLSLAKDLKRQSLLLDFLAYMIDINEEDKPETQPLAADYSNNIYVNHAVEHIRNTYSQHLTVQTIADFIGISRTHLNNCFQKELGLSVQKFLMDFRLYQAAFQLTSTTLQIQEIAERVGYGDSLTFSKAFKKKFQLSPSHYRLEKSNSPSTD